MSKPAEIVLKKCLCLKKTEKLLIITDYKLYSIGRMFFDEAKSITDNVKIIKIPIPNAHGTEPSKQIANEMLKYDVTNLWEVVICLRKKLIIHKILDGNDLDVTDKIAARNFKPKF